MTTTTDATPNPEQLLNSQGMLDPIQIKKSSAAKMRLADKTGNVALRKEAAAEQSFADRLGGRTALLSDELKRQIEQQKLNIEVQYPNADAKPKEGEAQGEKKEEVEEGVSQPEAQQEKKRRNKKRNKQQAQEEAQPQSDESESQDADIRQRAPLKPTSQPFQPATQKAPTQQALSQQQSLAAASFNSAFVGQATLPPEAIMLKLDAASKQSIADKTGNLVLKRTAALEQSLADKMAFVSAPGITTTALRAGRKGFMLEPLFQALPAAQQINAAQPQPTQQPQKQKQQKQMQQSKSMTSIPPQPQQQTQQPRRQMQHSSSSAAITPQTQQQQPQQRKQMQQSRSLTNASLPKDKQSERVQHTYFKSMQHSRSTGFVATRSDAPNWRQSPTPAAQQQEEKKEETKEEEEQKEEEKKEEVLETPTPTPAVEEPSSATESASPLSSSPSSSSSSESSFFSRIKQQIADVIAPLTPAAASM